MVTNSQVELTRAALNRLVGYAATDFAAVWNMLKTSDRMLISEALEDGWLALLAKYGDIAATLGADHFDEMASRLGIVTRLAAATIDREYALRKLHAAVEAPTQWANLTIALDNLVKQPYRRTIQRSAHRSGAAWARIPSGKDTCGFCLMLAARGAVYRSAETAGISGDLFHGDCDCVVILVRGPQDYPPSYDPADLFEKYKAAADVAASSNASDVLSVLRRQQDIR